MPSRDKPMNSLALLASPRPWVRLANLVRSAPFYNPDMKIVGLAAAALLLASCGGGSGPVPTRFDCHATKVDMSFWPEGHPPIASINAPEAKDPHIEISVDFDNLEEVFYFDANGDFKRGGAGCDESLVPIPESGVDGGVQERSATRVTCSLDTETVIWRSGPGEEPASIAVTAGNTAVIRVSLALDESTLTYNPQACTLGAPPS